MGSPKVLAALCLFAKLGMAAEVGGSMLPATPHMTPLAPSWSYDYGSSARNGPLVGETIIFVPTWNELHAVREADGVLLWKRAWTGYGYETPPALSPDGSTLYVITRDNSTTGPPTAIPLIEALTATRHYYLKALSGSDGSTLWVSEVPSSSLGPSPSVSWDGHTIFATLGGGLLCAFSAKTGQKLWEGSLQAQSSVTPVCSATGHVVFALSDTVDFMSEDEKVLYAFDAVTGKELWHVTTPHVSGEHVPVVSPALVSPTLPGASAGPHAVYLTAGFTDSNRGVYAYNGATGKLLWSYSDAPVELSQDGVGPDGESLFASTGASVGAAGGTIATLALSAQNGSALWTSPVRSLSPPAVTPDDSLVYAGHPGVSGFFGLDSETGEHARLCGFKFGGTLWRMDAKGDRVYVLGLDYRLYAYDTHKVRVTGRSVWGGGRVA